MYIYQFKLCSTFTLVASPSKNSKAPYTHSKEQCQFGCCECVSNVFPMHFLCIFSTFPVCISSWSDLTSTKTQDVFACVHVCIKHCASFGEGGGHKPGWRIQTRFCVQQRIRIRFWYQFTKRVRKSVLTFWTQDLYCVSWDSGSLFKKPRAPHRARDHPWSISLERSNTFCHRVSRFYITL